MFDYIDQKEVNLTMVECGIKLENSNGNLEWVITKVKEEG